MRGVRGRLVESGLDGLEIVIRVNYNDRWSFGETRSLERFETEISPIHRSTSTVHYRVFRRRFGVVSSFTGVVRV